MKKKSILRFTELDSLRGIASLCVVLFHYTWAYDYHFGLMTSDKFYFMYGVLGVQLFFIISGFVIFLTLKKSKNSIDFFVSRFSRLYPTYWASMFLTVIVIKIFPVPTLENYTLKEILVNFTMFAAFVKVRLIDQAYWTLKFELTFYFIMWVLFALKKLHYMDIICFFWLVLSILSIFSYLPFKKQLDVLLILEFSPLFIAGICFHSLKYDNGSYKTHILIGLSYIIHSLWLYKVHPIGIPIDISYLFVLFLIYCIFYLFVFDKLAFLQNKILVYLGTISYSLYLLHNVIGHAIIYRLKGICDKQYFYIPITITLMLILAILVTHFIEKPTLSYIRYHYDKFKKTRDAATISL